MVFGCHCSSSLRGDPISQCEYRYSTCIWGCLRTAYGHFLRWIYSVCGSVTFAFPDSNYRLCLQHRWSYDFVFYRLAVGRRILTYDDDWVVIVSGISLYFAGDRPKFDYVCFGPFAFRICFSQFAATTGYGGNFSLAIVWEALTLQQGFGGVIVLAGIVLARWSDRKPVS